MEILQSLPKPTKVEQEIAQKSYHQLNHILKNIHSSEAEIEIQETQKKIRVPLRALQLLEQILKAMSQGRIISIIPMATEITTQKASEILGCSRPHIVKLLEDGKIKYTKVGRHRRILYEDLINYKNLLKKNQKNHLIEIMHLDEESGLYDS